MESSETVNEQFVSKLVADISEVLLDAARSTFGVKTSNLHKPNQRKHCRKKKPWWSRECKIYQNRFYKAKRNYNKQSSLLNKIKYKSASKSYKKCIDRHI